MIYIAVNRSGSGAVTAGTFVSYLGAVLMLMSPLKRLAKVNEKIQMGVAAANSVFTLGDEAAEADPGQQTLTRPAGKLEYRNVCFQYDQGATEVLNDVSFVVKPGQSVALVGASGGGKSTVAALLLGFYRPTSGAILIDDIDIRSIALTSLREHMAIVTQETILFDASIRDNICYGSDATVDEARLEAAVQAAHVAEFAAGLPDGLHTLVGEQGIRLSGGQRQRIAIARALYKNAPILVMDEATSSLDSVSERLVKEAIDRLLANRTTLVIAHRLSTIESADQILVLDKGRIVESGRHAELLARHGLYEHLYRSQMQETSRLAV